MLVSLRTVLSNLGQLGRLEEIALASFHPEENLDRARVNTSELADGSARTTSEMFADTLANEGFHGASSDHREILPRKMSASTSRGILS
jgi:hypothetical protein